MITVSFFCTRLHNLQSILDKYETYSIIDEIIVVHLEPIDSNFYLQYKKTKFIYMPKSADFGLLSRYTYALNSKNRYVFIQDDDHIFKEYVLEKMYKMQQPLTGCHPRWVYDNDYKYKPIKGTKPSTAPIILTIGLLVDSYLLPDVIKLAKVFWKDDYQSCFNGEDIFLSRAISYITKQNEFPFIYDKSAYTLIDEDGALWKTVNNHKKRQDITLKIYDFFRGYYENKI